MSDLKVRPKYHSPLKCPLGPRKSLRRPSHTPSSPKRSPARKSGCLHNPIQKRVRTFIFSSFSLFFFFFGGASIGQARAGIHVNGGGILIRGVGYTYIPILRSSNRTERRYYYCSATPRSFSRIDRYHVLLPLYLLGLVLLIKQKKLRGFNEFFFCIIFLYYVKLWLRWRMIDFFIMIICTMVSLM